MKRIILSTMALLASTVAGCGSSTPAGPCASVTCSMNQFCDNASGACKTASVCATATCGAGTICDGTSGSATAGMCVAETCGSTQCTNGQVCNQATAACVAPGIPALGVQIDRMGRPAVNTALVNPFDFYPTASPETADASKARYNADASPAAWGHIGAAGNWDAAIAFHLGIIDGLDGVVNNAGTYQAATMSYTFGGQFLAQDYLLVDTTAGLTCKKGGAMLAATGYLHVEGFALAGAADKDCGGRQLDDDVMDTTYGFLSGAGAPVSDGISFNAAFPLLTAFPWSAAPM